MIKDLLKIISAIYANLSF